MAGMAESGILARHKEFLADKIDSDSGLLDKLQSNEVLTEAEICEIESKDTYHKRNVALLKCIMNHNKDDLLINALKETKQGHIVNYLHANAVYRSECGNDWPLTQNESSILNRNQEVLIDLIDPCDLIGRLFSKDVINRRQMEVILSKPTSHEKNRTFLRILRRRSLRDFRQTIACLQESNQLHIADILKEGGVVVRVHASVDEPVESVDETENELSSTIQTIVSGKSIEEISRILELTLFKCIAAKTGQSIVLYIYCQTMNELQKLIDYLTVGLLKSSCEQLFTRLLSRQKKVILKSIKISDEDRANLGKAMEEFKHDGEKYGTSAKEIKYTSTDPDSLVSLERKPGAVTKTLPKSSDFYVTRKQEQRQLPSKPVRSFFSKFLPRFKSPKRPPAMLPDSDRFETDSYRNEPHYASSEIIDYELLQRPRASVYESLAWKDTFDAKLAEGEIPSPFKYSTRPSQILEPHRDQSMKGTKSGICSPEFLKMVSEEVKRGIAYKCDSFLPGRAIIIDNKLTSEEDGEVLKLMFNSMQFFTEMYKNLTVKEIMSLLKAQREFQNHDIFVLFVLGRGNNERILCSDGLYVSIEELVTLFDGKHCPTYVNKPKLFFSHVYHDPKAGLDMKDVEEPTLKIMEDIPSSNCISLSYDLKAVLPKEGQSEAAAQEVTQEKADMVVIYSIEYGQSISNAFVKYLTEVFSESAHKKDLQTMLFEVFMKLRDKNVHGGEYNGSIRMRDTLRRKVYLLPNV